MNILEQILADKRIEINEHIQREPLERLEALTPTVAPRPGFVKALRARSMGLIAEVKRRSPSAGVIREPFDPAGIAQEYEAHGAAAVSCLMDEKYFGGGEKDFSSVREAIELPMLYKEFVVDPWQIAHAKIMGASAVLLIAGALSEHDLAEFIGKVQALELTALVEIHDREEMLRAVNAGATCIGINNRNLKTFETTLETTFELTELAPQGSTLVSESGIRTPEDVRQLKAAGAHAVLVGESLLREASPGEAASQLMNLV